MASVRVLPALIAVSIGALAFKGVDLAQAVAKAAEEEAAKPEEHAEEPAAPAAETATEEAPPAEGASTLGDPASGDKCAPGADYSAETGISAQEMQVLRSLSDRRQQLDARESALETREQTAAAAEARLNDQIAELKKVETNVQKLLDSVSNKNDERMAALVKTYETMKPKEAASIFNAMDDKVLVDLAKSMKATNLAPILAAMDTRRAEALTRMLAALAKPPASLDELRSAPG